MASGGFLSAYRKLLLEAGREELAQRLDVRGSILVDCLRQEGVLTTIQDEQLRPNGVPEKEGDSKYGNVLIDIILRKSNDEFDQFVNALHTSGQGSLADYFLTGQAVERLIRELQVALGRYFLDCYNDDLFSWHDEGHVVNLRDVYVPIQWVHYDKSSASEPNTLMDYHQVFLQNDDTATQKILIRGEASSGKTTFLRKVCQDWATLHVEGQTPTDEVRRSLDQFLIVLPVILRLVKKGATLESTLCDQLSFLSDSNRLTMKWMLAQKQESVLFILDGLDEYEDQTSTSINMLMQGASYSKASCVVTTRAEAVVRCKQWTVYHEAELKGFDEEHIKAYIWKFFEKHKEGELLASELCSSIFPKNRAQYASQEVKDLQELASNPGRLCMMCTLYKEDRTLSTNRTQLYTAFIAFILRRWEMKNIAEHKDRSPQKKILDNHRGILTKLGKLACLRVDGAMQVVFSSKDVEEATGEDVVKYGFLYKSHPVYQFRDCQVSFLHKSVQEYLAAYHIAQEENEMLLTDMTEKCYDLSSMRTEGSVLRFLFCFLRPQQCFDMIVSILRHHCDTKVTFWWEFLRVCKTVIDILCDFESSLPTEPEPIRFQVEEVHFLYYFPRVLVCTCNQRDNLSAILAYPPVAGKPITINCLETTEALFCYGSKPADYMVSFIPGCDISAVQERSAVLVVCGREMEIEVSGNIDKLEDLKVSNVHKLLGLPEKLSVKKLDSVRITSTDCHSNTSKIFHVGWLAHLLDMSETNLDEDDLKEMKSQVYKNLGKTKYVFLDKNDLSGAGLHLTELLANHAYIDELYLRSCNMTKTDLEEFSSRIQMLKSNKDLRRLEFSGNNLKGSGAELAQIVSHMSILRKLRLYDCNLHADDIEKFVNGLLQKGKSLMGVEPIGLNGNRLTGAGEHLARLFPLMKDCYKLELHNCHLNNADIRLIAEGVTGVQANEGDTNVDGARDTGNNNNIKGTPMQKLEAMVLSQNNLSDIKPLLHLLQYLPGSVFLIDIDSNPLGDSLLECLEYKDKIRRLLTFSLKNTGLSETAKWKLKDQFKNVVHLGEVSKS